MNKELFVALCDHIGGSVPEIRFIDFDRGQLSASGERPPVDWPCIMRKTICPKTQNDLSEELGECCVFFGRGV